MSAERKRGSAPTATGGIGDERDVIDGLRLDALFDGRRLHALTVVDAFTREALAIEVDQGIKDEQVVRR